MYVRPRYRRTGSSGESDRAPAPTTEEMQRRSHVAILPALILLAVGWFLARYSIIFPAVIGLFLLSGALGLLGSRLNPLSPGFYLTTKPSWTAIGTAFLAGAVLLWMTYEYYLHSWGPLLPRIPAL
ncbi:MAG TPA: hypothetical protein VKT21_06250 [Thermoplasmata archaeon]|nr:hypothetical protein [Thermoplasmata archaeon]